MVVLATGLPIVRPETVPKVRHWTLNLTEAGAVTAPDEFGLVGVSWPRSSRAPSEVRVRTSLDGRRWSKWATVDFEPDLGPDIGAEGNGRASTEPVWAGRARLVDVRFVGARPRRARVDAIDPGPDPSAPLPVASASARQPGIVTRRGWGADESIRRGAPDYAPSLKLGIVHHTATTNSYSMSESDNIVRSIYAYHVKTNGWDDIGYNFLVDRYGQIFEGRYGGITRNVIGAHSQGFNTGTTGVAVIGNFLNSRATDTAMGSLKRILAWRLDLGFVDPTRSTTYTSNGSNRYAEGTRVSLKNVAAHKDVGQTSCPGRLYDALSWLRSAAYKDGLPKLFEARPSRPVMTPNADKVADGLKLLGRLSSNMSWRVDVIDSANNLQHTVRGFGSELAVNWYGKDASGALVRHNTYRFRVTAKNSAGSIRTSYVPFKVWRYPNGTFFRTSSKRTYILHKDYLRRPSHWQARATRFRSDEFVSVGDSLTDYYPVASKLGFRDGSVVKADGRLYVISDVRKRPVRASTLSALGYDDAAIIDTTATALTPHTTGEKLQASDGYPNGATLRSSTGAEAWMRYRIARPFFSQRVRDSYAIRDEEMVGPADAEIAAGARADPLGFRDGTLVRVADGTAIYMISEGYRMPFSSGATFARMGFKTENIVTVTPGELALHPQGRSL